MNGFESALSLLAAAVEKSLTPTGQGILAWFLAWLFMWSGIAKLRRPLRAAAAMFEFRVVKRVRARYGAALGVGELSLAVALASGWAPRVSAGLAAAVLTIFWLLIARSLLAHHYFACFCFGDSASQLSVWTLARTAVLGVVAAALMTVSPTWDGGMILASNALLEAVSALSIVCSFALIARLPLIVRVSREMRHTIEMTTDQRTAAVTL